MVTQRSWHNLQGFIDYTRSKQIDDTGNHRPSTVGAAGWKLHSKYVRKPC